MKAPVLLMPRDVGMINNRVFCAKPECVTVPGKFLSCWHEVEAFARAVERASLIANGHEAASIPRPEEQP